ASAQPCCCWWPPPSWCRRSSGWSRPWPSRCSTRARPAPRPWSPRRAPGRPPPSPLAGPAIPVLGFVSLPVLSGTSTVCQLRAPRELRARIASLFMLGVGGGEAVGVGGQGGRGDARGAGGAGGRWVGGCLGGGVGLPAVAAVTGLLLPGIVVAVRLARPDLLE